MHIVVYRILTKDTMRASVYLQTMFAKDSKCSSLMKVTHNASVIDICDVRIDFRCGDVNKMAGLEPDYYNADTALASEHLACQASRVNGKGVNSLDEIFDIVVRHIENFKKVHQDIVDATRYLVNYRYMFPPEKLINDKAVVKINTEKEKEMTYETITRELERLAIKHNMEVFYKRDMPTMGIKVSFVNKHDMSRSRYFEIIMDEVNPDFSKIIDESLCLSNTNKDAKYHVFSFNTPRVSPTYTLPQIKDVKFECPATIVFWADGTKTVVRTQGEAYDPEKGLAMAISRKAMGNKRDYYHVFLKWLKKSKKRVLGPQKMEDCGGGCGACCPVISDNISKTGPGCKNCDSYMDHFPEKEE